MKTRYTIDFPKIPKKVMDNIYFGIPVKVTGNSPLCLRKSVEICARYFMREGYSGMLHYDSMNKHDDAICFLFVDVDHDCAIGAVCFRKRKYKNVENEMWAMHWAWIHPYQRNNGLLSTHKGLFDETFGYWYPEYPHSKAMAAFVKKHNIVAPKIINNKS